MTPKEYLMQACKLNTVIDGKMNRIERLHALDAVRKGYRETPDRHDIAERMAQMGQRLNGDIDRLRFMASEIEQRIADVPDARQRTILQLRYLRNMPWEQIAEQMSYDMKWLYKLHGRALEEMPYEDMYCMN